jgi:putative toxin-antitoxin system antitoxin component (TIGR02293 family)
MAAKKKSKSPTEYTDAKTSDATNAHTVSEPVATYTMSADAATTRTFGMMGMDGKKDFASIKSESDFIGLIRSGIPRQAMTNLMNVADISLNEMAAIVHTSDRTLRRYGPEDKLPQDQSERIIEMARLYSRGEDVLGSIEYFRQWMDTVLLPFGNKKPKEFLDTSIGIGMIMNELGRIQHGIFA